MCEQLDKIKLSAIAIHQTQLAIDIERQKKELLQMSLRVHALLQTSPPLKHASVIAVLFGTLSQDNKDACGHSCIAVSDRSIVDLKR